jgi:hypothetical protein
MRQVQEDALALEVAVLGPVHEHPEQVPEVQLGIEVVELARGDEREEVGRRLGVIVAADEEPRLAADSDAPQLALGDVVVEAQSTIVEEAPERGPLAHGVSERRAEQSAGVFHLRVLGLGPREEVVEQRSQELLAQRFALRRRLALPSLVQLEDVFR